MTMVERKAESIRKELEKLNARLGREQAKLAKKMAIAEKVGATCTEREWFAGMREAYTNDQKDAWFEAHCAQRDVIETISSIANAQKRLDKISGKAEENRIAGEKEAKEIERIGEIEVKANRAQQEADYEKWLAEFKAECLKDGIEIDKACATYFTGKTASGKNFFIDINNGWTIRSRHCYSLRVAGETIFTSGEFLTAYRYLMK